LGIYLRRKRKRLWERICYCFEVCVGQ